MTREQVIKLALKRDWKLWGKFTRREGSSYQCLRKGNSYVWVGHVYIQTRNHGHALPFITATESQIIKDEWL